MAGDPKFDYLLGIAALDSGRPQDAVFAFERVLAVDPDNALARAEAARAYFELAEYETARTEFDYVKQSPATPDSARASVDEYLARIDRATAVSPFSGFVTVAAGYDSNINSATDQGRVAIPLLANTVFRLVDDAQEQSHAYTLLAGGLTGRHPLSEKISLIGGTRGYFRSPVHASPWENSTFSTRDIYGYAGLSYHEGSHWVTVTGSGENFGVDGSTLRNNYGGQVQWTYQLDQSNRFTMTGQYLKLEYPALGNRDADRYVGSAGYLRSGIGPREGVISAAFYGGTEDEEDSDFPNFGHDLYGGRIGGSLAVIARLRAFASFAFEQRDYNGDDPIFLKTRDDLQLIATGGVRFTPHPNWEVRPNISYTRNDSNIPIFDYDRYVAGVDVSLRF